MRRSSWIARIGACLGCLTLSLVPTAQGVAEGFRVDNRVFVEGEKEPITQSTTIFYDDLVYDYLKTPEEITVFDRAAGRIVLLDPVRKTCTELSTTDLESLADRLRGWAAAQPSQFLRFTAEPVFDEKYDSATGELRMASPWLSYRVTTTTPIRSEVVPLYREFCDWYCLLNTRLNPGSRPPFPRMCLNESLERLDRVPCQVHLTIRPAGEKLFGEKIVARSEHKVIPHLLESDRSLVAQTDEFMAIFRPLPFREYQTRIQPSR